MDKYWKLMASKYISATYCGRLFLFLLICLAFTVGAVGIIGLSEFPPDLTNAVTQFVLIIAALICYVAIWFYVRGIPADKSVHRNSTVKKKSDF